MATSHKKAPIHQIFHCKRNIPLLILVTFNVFAFVASSPIDKLTPTDSTNHIHNHHVVNHNDVIKEYNNNDVHDLIEDEYDHILNINISFEVSIAIRSLIFLYCCLVIGYLCDEYFVPSLQDIGQDLKLPNDLIGAILIPFGTSGPEIFSSVIGVFFAENDIGTGAIIGSAVYNMLVIPAACGLAAVYFIGHPIQLQEAPILRDLLFYIISVIVLVLVVKDNTVDLLDSSLLILLFAIYISVMLYNAKFKSNNNVEHEKNMEKNKEEMIRNNVINNINNNLVYPSHVSSIVTIDNLHHHKQQQQQSILLTNESTPRWHMKQYWNSLLDMINTENSPMDCVNKVRLFDEKVAAYYTKNSSMETKLYAFVDDLIDKENNDRKCRQQYETLNNDEDDGDDNGFGFTDYFILRWLLMPFSAIFFFTMPSRYSYIIFLMSIGWLSALSYVTVWSISGLSDILGIPHAISGMTILAAGSAVPDLVTSIIVIKKTRAASMGICSAIASNIFAILLGLGLPWTIRIILNWVKSGSYQLSRVVIESDALPYTSLTLLATVFLLYITFRMCRWKIAFRFALICILIHCLFTASNVALELTIITDS
ncbi:hypothetical protein RDWZM_000807 [Blomia tropicalis]|uniref:Sodium/calcium exchanger membrane region domain-containing protein n=1 Tax=Blomia tropicalis TaxID=40697 RepID=A0A9Q0MB21_BLOTA|nr:hypothetical protein RDWZM_000807 [Blomia tropicalis]